MGKDTKKKTKAEGETAAVETPEKLTIEEQVSRIRAINRKRVAVVPNWAKDPIPRGRMRRLVRAAMDFQKIGISMAQREISPTPTNPAELEDDDLLLLLSVGASMRDMENIVKKSLKHFLKQSEIGLWLLDQPGLGSGWLSGYILAEFPDIYDAGICLECGRHLDRQVDGTFLHGAPPERKDRQCSGVGCAHDGELMEEGTYRIHERKPSTFIRFAGLATVDAWACPICHYTMKWNSEKKGWTHPNITKLPEGYEPCKHRQTIWRSSRDGVPSLAVDGETLSALPTRASDSQRAGEKRSYNSQLRAKLIGPYGVADAMIKATHPKYYQIYKDYKHRVAQRDKWRTPGWIDMMGKRAMIYRFIIDFFTTWRKSEGLPCRPPYEEQYLGVVHHP